MSIHEAGFESLLCMSLGKNLPKQEFALQQIDMYEISIDV